jgi:thiol:disulfide interchange protein DsbD
MVRVLALTLLLIGASSGFSQKLNPVQWSIAVEPASAAPGSVVTARLVASLKPGWHIYSLTTPEGGPTPTILKADPHAAVESFKFFQPKPGTKFDPNFKVNTEIFEREVTFLAQVKLADTAKPGVVDLSALARYQACTDKECLPRKAPLTARITVDPKAKTQAAAIPAGYSEFTGKLSASAPPRQSTSEVSDEGLASFLAVAFGFGLAAIFTPCVFPMIPITLSFFLNREGGTRGESLKQAAVFCLGIVVLFTGIGLSIAAILGPFGVVQLGSNVWVNAFIATVFIFFGLSLLGAFEITLPSALLTKMDKASQRGGVAGTLLMGLTFALTSFACVGPFMGTLLVGSVQRGGAQPALGMAAFAAGLSSPFFLLALFPSFLQRMPRSGGWLARVKVVLGFIVLAAALKYISSIDQVLQWNLLTRERFLAAWFVLFLLPGLYLLGFLRMEGVRSDETLGVGRTLTGAIFIVFAVSLLPGMFGGRLGELDSLVPLPSDNGSALAGSGTASRAVWLKNDFNSAAARAREEGKLIFVSFTGYACTNCHWMKANMFTRPEIAGALQNYVLLELYTDGTDPASEQNQQLQEGKFGTAAIPFYAIMDPDQRVISTAAGLTRDAPKYLSFLRSGSPQTTASVQ